MEFKYPEPAGPKIMDTERVPINSKRGGLMERECLSKQSSPINWKA